MIVWNKRMLLCWCFTALRHFSGHFGRGQLIYPHCSWASLLGSFPVLSAHSFASNWQLPFLNQRKGRNDRRNYFLTNLRERMLQDVRIEPATVRIPGGRAFGQATVSGYKTLSQRNQRSRNFQIIWATSWENLFMPYANDKGADQPAHPRSLISVFVVRWLDSIRHLLAIAEISRP